MPCNITPKCRKVYKSLCPKVRPTRIEFVLCKDLSFEIVSNHVTPRVEHSCECRVLNSSWTQLLVQVGTDYLEHFQLSIVSLLATMSLSKSPNAPLSADEARTLTSLLMRMQAAGLEPAADHQGYGAMTDASKRRKPESEVSLEEEFEHIEPFVQYEVEKLETEKPKSSTDGSVGKTRVHIPLVNVGGVKIPPNEKDMEDGAPPSVNFRRCCTWECPTPSSSLTQSSWTTSSG